MFSKFFDFQGQIEDSGGLERCTRIYRVSWNYYGLTENTRQKSNVMWAKTTNVTSFISTCKSTVKH